MLKARFMYSRMNVNVYFRLFNFLVNHSILGKTLFPEFLYT